MLLTALYIYCYLLYYICIYDEIYNNMPNRNEYKAIKLTDVSFLYDSVCLPPDKQIPLHSQSSWELSCIITGQGTRLLSDVSESFEEGEVVMIPPGVQHCWYFNKDKTDKDGNIENITIFFSGDFLNNVSFCFPEFSEPIRHISSLGNATIFSDESRARIYSLMLRMRDESVERRVLTFVEILLVISEDKTGRVIVNSKPRSKSEVRMSQIRGYVNCNFAREISIDEISAHVGMNKSSFCTFIRNETGQTFTNYVNSVRLSLAANLLKDSDLHISEIGASVGLTDTPYFCRIFKKKYGLTPTEYRKRCLA